MHFVVDWFFSKLSFCKNSSRNIIRVSKSLDTDKAQYFVRSDLGPSCVQKLQSHRSACAYAIRAFANRLNIKLLTEHHLEFLSLKRGFTVSSVYTCQNATLFEITCHISIIEFLSLKCSLFMLTGFIILLPWWLFTPGQTREDRCIPRLCFTDSQSHGICWHVSLLFSYLGDFSRLARQERTDVYQDYALLTAKVMESVGL